MPRRWKWNNSMVYNRPNMIEMEMADRNVYDFDLAQKIALADLSNRAYLASPQSPGLKLTVRGPREQEVPVYILVHGCDELHDGYTARHTHTIFTDGPDKYGL